VNTTLMIPMPPFRREGICPCGARVYGTATRPEFESGELTAFCQQCDSHTLPVWEPFETYFQPRYSYVFVPVDDAPAALQSPLNPARK